MVLKKQEISINPRRNVAGIRDIKESIAKNDARESGDSKNPSLGWDAPLVEI